MKKILFLTSLFIITTSYADFSDVATDYPYLEAINYAQENNIVSWYKDWTFQPENKITREEFTKIIIKSNFSDSEIYWEDCFPDVNWWDFEKYICTAKREGIIGWYKDWDFKPKDNISFLESAKIIISWLWKKNEVWNIDWLWKYWRYLSSKTAIPNSIENIDSLINRWEMVEIVWRLKEWIIWKKSRYMELLSDFFYRKENGNYKTWDIVTSFKISTSELLWWWYIKSDNNIYCQKNELVLTWVDTDTFKAIWDLFWKDKDYIYFRNEKIEWVDRETFVALGKGYSKDKNSVYYEEMWREFRKFVSVNPETFEVLDYWYTKDKDAIYYQTAFFDILYLSWVNPNTFEILDSWYSRDDGHVYYLWRLLNQANPDTFKILDNGYSKDEKNVYYEHSLLTWATSETFVVINFMYAVDENSCYYYGKLTDMSYCEEYLEN